ncbi:preprotein translocase subunit SecE [Teichococcus vastitatis]|jgi:hypothetical protein|uniref:Preprotein translocase subunit SecE n=1 Tax=Teichococcus vastitatis TaxID=2307076 RepID=A0ABS9W349_9PROT|nr:preprotein translocase subunit SecE [Pseudoroseomonas vastitatis]MCI0753717.1 preprotein translocase subunit SecE [Pseudoroseomonas vastitatis]
MAEANHEIDFVEVKSQDILADRVQGWDAFIKATKWAIGAVILLLVMIYLFAG